MSDLHVRLSGRIGALALDVALEAPAGVVTALVGPSAAGKTTLLRAVAGLERLEGEVRCGDETWQGERRFAPPHRRGVGYVFQHGALLPHLTVAANLAYARRRAIRASGLETDGVALLDLAPLLHRRPEGLSGGERRRVAVARALAARPRLMLLDEPLSGLDAASREALLPRLKAVLISLGVPVLYVSHDAAEVREVAGRVLRMEAGRLRPGAPEEASDPLDALGAEDLRGLARSALTAGLAPTPPRLG